MRPLQFHALDSLGKIAWLACGIFLGAAGFAAAPPPAGTQVPGSSPGFDAFRLIGSLNIFDSTRVGRVDEAPKERFDTISFVGTMDYDKGLLAFFDSSDRSYRKALHAGDAIADFAVGRIGPEGVELTRNGKSLTLLMGQQLRRKAGGDWEVGAGGTRAAPAPERDAAAAAPSAVPADASDTLKRLMAQRQQQLKQ